MKTYAVAALLALAIFNPVYDDSPAHAQARSARTNPLYPEQAIRDWNGQRFNVTRISSLEDGQRERVTSKAKAGASYAGAMMSTIRSNRKLASALASQGVGVGSIAIVRQAFSGGLIFYVK